MLRLVIGRAAAFREEPHSQQAEHEPAHVREVGHAASAAAGIGEVDGPVDRLLGEPDEEEEIGRQLDEGEEDDEED